MIDAVILAAGTSQRMSSNKLICHIGETPLIIHTLLTFFSIDRIDNIYVVTIDKNIESIIKEYSSKNLIYIKGGSSRTQSVQNALQVCKGDYVLIHDGARAFVSKDLINSVINCAIKNDSAIPFLPVSDSIRKVNNNKITGFANREEYCSVQTPQGFNLSKLKKAYKQINEDTFTDDSEVFAKFIENPTVVKGDINNRKITYDKDLFGINARVGTGYDIHKLKEGKRFILGGVLIPHNKGMVAHSDGDVLIHSIIDSLLSMANERDIGYHFPDTQMRYNDISSMDLLKKVKNIIKHKNIKINNISSTILCQEPKLSPYIEKMVENIAGVLKIDTSKISIGATTTEGIGKIGKQNAVAVLSICSGT